MPSLTHILLSLICRFKPKFKDTESVKSGKLDLKRSKTTSPNLKHQTRKTRQTQSSVKSEKRFDTNICYCEHTTSKKMPACQNNNPSNRTHQMSKKRNQKRNKEVQQYSNSVKDPPERQQLKSKSLDQRHVEARSHLAGSSTRGATCFNDKFGRRSINTPLPKDIKHKTLSQLNNSNYLQQVRRIPTRPSSYENPSRFLSDSNRFQTPPNRCILKSDGNQVISRFRDQYYVQSEPGSCGSINTDSSFATNGLQLFSANSSHFDNERRYATRNYNDDFPPEYSEPPSYSA